MKQEEQIVKFLARKDIDPQQKLDIIFGFQQPFNKLKNKTNPITSVTTTKGVAAPKVDAVKLDSNKPTPKQQRVKDGVVKNAV